MRLWQWAEFQKLQNSSFSFIITDGFSVGYHFLAAILVEANLLCLTFFQQFARLRAH